MRKTGLLLRIYKPRFFMDVATFFSVAFYNFVLYFWNFNRDYFRNYFLLSLEMCFSWDPFFWFSVLEIFMVYSCVVTLSCHETNFVVTHIKAQCEPIATSLATLRNFSREVLEQEGSISMCILAEICLVPRLTAPIEITPGVLQTTLPEWQKRKRKG